MVDQEEGKKVTKVLFNNFVTRLRPKVKVCIRHSLIKFQSKGLHKEIKALKSFNILDVAKFVTLSQKPTRDVISDISLSADYKALTYVAAFKVLQEEVQKFRNEYPNWTEEVPNIIKSWGMNCRKRRLLNLKKKGKLNEVLKSDEKMLTILNEVAGLGLDKHLLQQMQTDAEVTKKKAKKGKVKLTRKENKMKKIKQGEDVDEEEDDDENEIEQDEDSDKEDDENEVEQGEDEDEEEKEEKEIKTNENKSKIIKQKKKSKKIANKKSNLKSKNDKQNLKDVTKLEKSLSKPSKSQTFSETSSSKKVGNEVMKNGSSKNIKKKKRNKKVTKEGVKKSENELTEMVDSDSPDQTKEKSESEPILKKHLKRKTPDVDSNGTKIFRSKVFRGDDSSGRKNGVRFGGGGGERGFREGRGRGNSRSRGSGRGSQYRNKELRTSFSKDGEEVSISEKGRRNRGGFSDKGRGKKNDLEFSGLIKENGGTFSLRNDQICPSCACASVKKKCEHTRQRISWKRTASSFHFSIVND